MLSNRAVHEALIPMVGSAGAVCSVVCNGQLPPPHPAQLDRRASALLETGLYAAGQQAIAAVSALHLPRSGWLAPPQAALTVLNPGDIAGLAPENARSAELGLALCWLLHLCGSPLHGVIATGRLEPGDGRDVPVGTIHHLGAKLELVAAHFRRPGASTPPRYLLMPALEPDGGSSLQRHAQVIASLRLLGIAVHAVTTLREAAELLGLRRLGRSPRERLVRRAVATSVGIAALGGTLTVVIQRPLELGFATVASTEGRILSTPARSQPIASGGVLLLTPCPSASSLPLHPIGERLAVRLRQRSGDPLPVYGIAVAVSSSTGAKVLPLPQPRLDGPSESAFTVAVAPPEEENLLVVLARRLVAYEPTDIQDRLQALLMPLQPSERLSAARNWLRSQASGYAEYFFRTVPSGACAT